MNIDIYCRLSEWGYEYKTVNHGADEFARDGDGFHEVHINYGGRILVPSAFMGYGRIEEFHRRNLLIYLGFLRVCA